jgi:signal transduction histidine kinase
MTQSKLLLNRMIGYAALSFTILFSVQSTIVYLKGIFPITPSSLRLGLLAIAFSFVYLLRNWLGRELKAALTLMLLISGVILYPVYAPGTDPSDVFITAFSVLIVAVMPYVIFDPITQELKIWIWNVLIVFSGILGIHFGVTKISMTKEYAGFIQVFFDEPMIPVVFLASFFFINLIIFRTIRMNQEIENDIILSNQELKRQYALMHKQQQSLEFQNLELNKIGQDLEQANKQLQAKVYERTSQLEQVTRSLLKYGYLNSHLLRAPIARIKSTLMLREDLSRDRVESFISESVEELDQTVSLIQQIINVHDHELERDIDKIVARYYRQT